LAVTRIVGIDVGLKRVGIAWSDPSRTIAVSLGTYNQEEAVAFLDSKAEMFSDILIGWPFDLKGEEGDAVAMAKSFESRLKRRFPGKQFHRFDERFTSVMAQQAILASGITKSARRDKSLVDAVAASILLQNFLDHLKR
jgi:putative Holliday junction resolvase